ncbi:MAG: spore germination protein GerW family protein [Clostridia bacterium]
MSNVSDLMMQTVEKIRQVIDTNTIIGDPIVTADGTTLIPITKMSIGIGSGGADLKSKDGSIKDGFGGGSGAGITISPIAIVVISKGETRILPINGPANTTADRVVEMVPDVVSKISDLFEKKTKKDDIED